MEPLTPLKAIILAVNLASAFAAFAAAWFWFLSARGAPKFDFSWNGLGQEQEDALNSAMASTARWNRVAACWAGLSAVLMGVNLLLGL